MAVSELRFSVNPVPFDPCPALQRRLEQVRHPWVVVDLRGERDAERERRAALLLDGLQAAGYQHVHRHYDDLRRMPVLDTEWLSIDKRNMTVTRTGAVPTHRIRYGVVWLLAEACP